MLIGIVATAATALFLLYLVTVFNRLVKRRNQVDNAWAQIDVQLKRRYDLVPNLVATVASYAAHERGVMDAVTATRERAVGSSGPAEAAVANGMLSGALRSLLAIAEAYPDLKANTNFLALQQELATTEDKTAYARQYYNDAVLGFNNSVSTFPTVVFARMLGFASREFFRVAENEAGHVRVRF